MTCISANRHLRFTLLRPYFRMRSGLQWAIRVRVAVLFFAAVWVSFPMLAQEPKSDSLKVRNTFDMRVGNPRSTGRSSGVVATVNVENNGSRPIDLKRQFFYVPPSKTGSGYVGRIPRGLKVEPDTTLLVEVHGYRINASRPPVGDGEAMPPASRWIVFTEIDSSAIDTTPHTTLAIISGPEQRPFRPSDIPDILASTGFISDTVLRTLSAIFPSTIQPVQGTIDPVASPTDFAALLTAVVVRVEWAATQMIKGGEIKTPLSEDRHREYETLVLHAVWFATSVLTGEEYTREDFAKEIHGRSSSSDQKLTAVEKEELSKGIDDLWSAISRVALRAGVVAGINAGIGY